jgi:hypothetical protein
MPSPYEIVLGDALGDLHPRLRTYFGAIPDGRVGRGSGVFETVGTPRRWLWPVLALLSRHGIAFPVWEHDVPFDVENRPARGPRGDVAVTAIRTFRLAGGERAMSDAITADNRGRRGDWRLVDHLGPARRVSASFAARVHDGALQLRSTAVSVRVAGRSVRLLRPVSPVVVLTERFDDERGRQHVSITLGMPMIGRIYEYAGFFTYGIEPDATGTEPDTTKEDAP